MRPGDKRRYECVEQMVTGSYQPALIGAQPEPVLGCRGDDIDQHCASTPLRGRLFLLASSTAANAAATTTGTDDSLGHRRLPFL